ncbi:MAG: glutamate 5-kinase [Candidatus Omnitrophota bacterium]
MQKDLKLKKIVVKIGTRVLTDSRGYLDESRIKALAGQISQIRSGGIKVVLVSSGAIGSGMALLGLTHRPGSLSKLQACAAIGQSHLMQTYDKFFKEYGYLTAQVLLTQEDLNNRKRYLNAKNTISALLEQDVIPVVNENDTVSVEEIKFGDNDRLSSLVADLVGAELLVLLTDVDGLYSYEDHKKACEPIAVVDKITQDITKCIRSSKSRLSTGGMATKLEAARTAVNSGILCVIASGLKEGTLTDIASGKRVGTIFLPSQNKMAAKKRWLAHIAKTKGAIMVDAGAREALARRNKSLLASGIIGRTGVFNRKDIVSVMNEKNVEFARGVINFSSAEIDKIKGLKTAQMHEALGYRSGDEVIHKDDLAIL